MPVRLWRLHAEGMLKDTIGILTILTILTGSGTILDALRISVPLIVVPNEELLDNHQIELAGALAEQEYVVHGRLGQLTEALEDAEQLRKRSREWPPPNSGYHRQYKSLKTVIDDEMGFLD